MAKITFANQNAAFGTALRRAVDEYFRERGIKKTGNWRLYHKAVIILPATALFYVLLLSGVLPTALALILSGTMGLMLAAIGFNVMHDACHGAFSSRRWVNNILGLSLNALGGNAFFWKQKHNILHHTYTNVEGLDDDIAQSKLLRQCPSQPWMRLHSYQHHYLPVAYGLTMFVWVLIRDFDKYFRRKIHNTPLQPMSVQEHVLFWASKALYVFFYMALPIYCVGFWPWLIGWSLMNVVAGIVLSYVFQLAHAVEGPVFENGHEDRVLPSEWAAHQVLTTANFAPRNKALSWFVGGLNFQVEHHLFPRVAHVHYPALSRIVQEQCNRFGLPYHCHQTLGGAIKSHLYIIKELGRRPQEATTQVAHA
ncbi:fatty acid desaturase family protein [Flaviaesturariibacter terrae]